MDTSRKVSVIIPLYNQAEFVSETIESILNQTYKNYEIVVVNDASTDNSLEVVSKYAQHIKAIITHPVNRGLPATRNTAIKNSTGELILPLDSDDKIDPTHLEKTTAAMVDGVGLVSTWLHIEPTQEMREQNHWPHHSGHPGSGYPIFPPTREQILNGNCLCVCSMFRRRVWEEVGGYPEEMNRGSEDWAFWAKIVCNTNWKVAVVPEHLFHYRVHPKSMCRSVHMAPFQESLARIRAMCNA